MGTDKSKHKINFINVRWMQDTQSQTNQIHFLYKNEIIGIKTMIVEAQR